MLYGLRQASAFAALLAVSLAPTAHAQATLRPVPRIAHSWGSAEAPRFAREASAVPAAGDLDFIGPRRIREGVYKPQPAEQPEVEGQRFVDVDFHLSAIAGSKFHDAPGELSTQRGGWQAAFGTYNRAGMSYAFEVGTEASFYDFGGGASPAPGVSDPFNDVYDTSVSGRFLFQQTPTFEVYGGVEFGLAGEDKASVSDSVYVGGALAMRYRAADDFALLAGIAGVSRFEDSPWILPYIGFDWRVTDKLRVLTEAAEIHIDWQASERWTVGAVTAYDFRQYRLNEEGPLNGGAFRDEEIRLGGSLGFEAREGLEFQLEAGTLLWREATFIDGKAGKLAEAETGSPLYLRLGLSLSF